jgi:hypothetical protein
VTSTLRRLATFSAAVAITLAIAGAANATGEADVTWGLYKLRAQECAQRAAMGCSGSNAVAQPTVPNPSRAAVPARLRRTLLPARQ